MAVCLAMAVLSACFPMDAPEAKEAPTGGIGLLEAVRAAVSRRPEILLQKEQKAYYRGGLESAASQFDHTLGATVSHNHSETPYQAYSTRYNSTYTESFNDFYIDDTKVDTSTFKADLTRQFRNGISIGPELVLTHKAVEDEIVSGGPSNTVGKINFVITVPLLKGLGVEAADAGEIAARKNHEAAVLELRHTVARSVYETVSAYWNCLAAKKNLELMREAEDRAALMVRNTRILIREDEVPAADIETVLANQANKTGNRIRAEQSLMEAKDNLGLVMGLSYEEIDALPLPADDFPEPDHESVDAFRGMLPVYRDRALLHRADYLALKKKAAAAKAILTGAENNLLPRLDLQMNAGYQGMDNSSSYQDYYRPFFENGSGLNAGFILRYEFPVENNAAKGLLRQKTALYRQALISTQDNMRSTLSAVARSMAELKRSAEGLARYREAVRSYRAAVENEKKKRQLGMSTLLDLVNTEDRLTNAVSSEISARNKYAGAVVGLRYETGTLLRVDDTGTGSVIPEDLVSIPTVKDVESPEMAD